MNSNINLSKVIFVVILIWHGLIYGKTITTYSVNSSAIKNLESIVDNDTLVFIELDNNLVIPKSLMFSFGSNPYRMFIDNIITLAKKNPAYNDSAVKWYKERKIRLVEDDWINLIENIKEKGAKIYGICSVPIIFKGVEQKRHKELLELGVKFTQKVNKNHYFYLDREMNSYSIFYKGIIFNHFYGTADSMIKFFKKINFIPKKLIFIDHMGNNIEKIESIFRVFDIDLYTIMYLGAHNIKGSPDHKIVKFQQKELILNKNWIEDENAEEIINKTDR